MDKGKIIPILHTPKTSIVTKLGVSVGKDVPFIVTGKNGGKGK